MSAKIPLIGALVWTLIMAAGASGFAVLARDTATTEQGPLNIDNLDSVRWIAEGQVQALWPMVAGLGILAILLVIALKNCSAGSAR